MTNIEKGWVGTGIIIIVVVLLGWLFLTLNKKEEAVEPTFKIGEEVEASDIDTKLDTFNSNLGK